MSITWGLPNELHAYSYHPDEFLIVGSSYINMYSSGEMFPGFYNYPSLYLYLSTVAYNIAFAYGVEENAANLYLVPRALSAILGVLACVATFWSAAKYYGVRAGLFAFALIAVAPLHVQHSRYATVDVASTLFVALALGSAALIYKNASMKNCIYAGVLCGLAAGTKYNAGLVVLAPIAAYGLGGTIEDDRKKSVVPVIVILLCTLFAFTLSTPGWIVEWQLFKNAILYEAQHTSTGHGLVFAHTGNGLLYTFGSSLWYGLGFLTAFLVPAAIIYAVKTRDKMAWAVLAFFVPYYLLISFSEVRFARYALPLIPAVAILGAMLFHAVWKERENMTRVWAVGRRVLTEVLVLCLIISLIWTYVLVRPLGIDPRDAAAEKIFSEIPDGSKIALLTPPWFYTPPLSDMFGFGTLDQRLAATQSTSYDVVVCDMERTERWTENKDLWPDVVIMTDFELEDVNRLKHIEDLAPALKEEVDRIDSCLAFVASAKAYDELYSFRPRIKSFWLDPPHDMSYEKPEIYVFERTERK